MSIMLREPATTDWVMGRCWLGCGHVDLPVRWIGPASMTGPEGTVEVHMYGCSVCIDLLYRMAVAEQQARDRPPHYV